MLRFTPRNDYFLPPPHESQHLCSGVHWQLSPQVQLSPQWHLCPPHFPPSAHSLPHWQSSPHWQFSHLQFGLLHFPIAILLK